MNTIRYTSYTIKNKNNLCYCNNEEIDIVYNKYVSARATLKTFDFAPFLNYLNYPTPLMNIITATTYRPM